MFFQLESLASSYNRDKHKIYQPNTVYDLTVDERVIPFRSGEDWINGKFLQNSDRHKSPHYIFKNTCFKYYYKDFGHLWKYYSSFWELVQIILGESAVTLQ